ncbi:MAG: biotin--[acetyl-CoA-carboxylase] ligase, partial [Acidobacteria bacterium]|nr:biotin--[acetyl-CoA-carboxylase] ligase [Acidobacteriota bacterium]MCA1609182.1 biotin--[acetyl-CoA-carboxylase] ligase [Acidobacteriota bacterium]
MNITILKFDEIDSTNSEAMRQAGGGANEGLCIVARKQTAGRGRHGRVWESPEDAGLYFSIILRPKIDYRFLPLLTLMAGISVRDTLCEIDLRPDIKWVNDVLIDGKKISGVLAETVDTGDGVVVVLGIGINIRDARFAWDVGDGAT